MGQNRKQLQSLWLWSRGVVGSTSKGPNVVVVMADDADLLPGSVESMPYVRTAAT